MLVHGIASRLYKLQSKGKPRTRRKYQTLKAHAQTPPPLCLSSLLGVLLHLKENSESELLALLKTPQDDSETKKGVRYYYTPPG